MIMVLLTKLMHWCMVCHLIDCGVGCTDWDVRCDSLGACSSVRRKLWTVHCRYLYLIMCVRVDDAFLSFRCRLVGLAEGRVRETCCVHPRPWSACLGTRLRLTSEMAYVSVWRIRLYELCSHGLLARVMYKPVITSMCRVLAAFVTVEALAVVCNCRVSSMRSGCRNL